MTDIELDGVVIGEHDHAWRRVRTHEDGVFGEYRCDLCNLAGASDVLRDRAPV